MMINILLVLVGVFLSANCNFNQKKKCKNPVECYADAIQILEVDREFLKAKMTKCGDSANKLIEQVKIEVQTQFQQEGDKRVAEMEKIVKKNIQDIQEIYIQLETIKEKLNKVEQEQTQGLEDLQTKYEVYRKEVKGSLLEVQKNIQVMVQEQQELKIKAEDIKQEQKKQEQELGHKLQQVKVEGERKIEAQAVRMEKKVQDNEQVTEFKRQILDLQLQIGKVKANGEELKALQISLEDKQDKEQKRLGEVEKVANNREYIESRLGELQQQLKEVQRNSEQLKVQQNDYAKQVVQIDQDYAQRVKQNQEQFVKRLDDLISKNELIVELQDVKRQFGGVLQLQEQMKFNLTHIALKNKEQEKEQVRQHSRIADIGVKNQNNDHQIRQELHKELTSIKDTLQDILKKQEAQRVKAETLDSKHELLIAQLKTKHNEYDTLQNNTYAFYNEVMTKEEVQKTLTQLRNNVQELMVKQEQVGSQHRSAEVKYEGLANTTNRHSTQIAELTHSHSLIETELKNELNQQLQTVQQQLQTLSKAFEGLRNGAVDQNAKNDMVEKQINVLMTKVSELLDDKPDPMAKKFENLSRKEVNVQLKVVLESLRQIKKSHEDIINRHNEVMAKQKEHSVKLDNQQAEMKGLKELQKGLRRLRKAGKGQLVYHHLHNIHDYHLPIYR